MHRNLLRRAAPLLALILFGGAGAAAGGAVAAVAPPIVGIVTDTAGAPLANARVVLSRANRVTTTGGDGRFTFRSLSPGTYHIDASFPGYAPGHAEVVVPATGADVSVRIELRPSPLTLEGVIFTGTPGGSDPLAVTQSTTQISGKEFDRQLSATIAETLSDEPGISARYAGPAASLPVIRGLTGERVLMLENGQRTGDLSGTSADHALSVDPLSATRIEVVRGPASLLYGSSALGGVVNVLGTDIPTSVPSHVEGYVAAQGVSVTPGGALTAEAIAPLGSSLAVAVAGGFRDVGDVRVGGGDVLGGTSLRNLHADVGLGFVGESLSGGVAVNGYDFNYGLPSDPDGEGGIRIDGRRYEVHGRGQWVVGGGFLQQVDANASAQWYAHDEIEAGGEVGTNFDLRTQTVDLRANTDVGFAKGTLGASGLAKRYSPTGEEALTPPATSTTGGVFVYQEIPFGSDEEHAARLQLGARYDAFRIRADESEDFGPARSRDFGAVSGSVGLTVPVGDLLSFGGSVARAFRAPTTEELYSNGFHAAAGSFDIGNPQLDPETNLGVEAVLRVQSARVNGQFSGYLNRVDDFIAPRVVGDTLIETEDGDAAVPLTVFRQADATLRGVEGKVEMVVADHVVAGIRGDVVRGRFTDGGPLPFMPAGHFGGEVRWDNGGTGIGVDAQHTFAQSDVPENELATGAYTLVGVNVAYTRTVGGQVHSITLRADNLFDVEYRDATSRIKEFAPNPGRNLALVYRLLY